MLVSVIAIGNSKGIRLPKTILDQLHISDKLDLEVENEQIILKPVNALPRHSWSEAFIKMHKEKQDSLLITDSDKIESFEWEW